MGTEFTDSGVNSYEVRKVHVYLNLSVLVQTLKHEPKCTFCHNKQTRDFNYSPLINKLAIVSNLSNQTARNEPALQGESSVFLSSFIQSGRVVPPGVNHGSFTAKPIAAAICTATVR